ncbi:hypothetical protein PC9H_011165 [Pleurotus ostreatus]|uniref:Uncharacterized protein n=1 Tax=Pleurotus ostreatus TaxID=5322 RepID=A0A8H6ZNT9_PLEOS|nr:uncharacterized protein PC9H_011165 [Pleurotus ostreatus]KAF7423001.1 hypothetical protein PC9H_011165 [Pleurotus ostreatus]KAJ8691000.1 hypothetical protein PTI98_010616 [Pleurotus ostreatus]
MAPTPAKRTHDLINEALGLIGPRTTKKTRLERITNNDALTALQVTEALGKAIPRLIDAYRHPRQLIVIGSSLALAENTPEIITGGAALPLEVVRENERLKLAYKSLVLRQPQLPQLIEEYRKNNFNKWHDIIAMIANTCSQTRSNDSSTLRDKLEYFLVDPKEVVPRELSSKVARGWNNQWTAERLCAQRYLEKFHKDPDSFMLKVQKGARKYQQHTDWPAFLYNASAYDKDDPESGLFKHQALVKILRHVLIGPSAAKSNSRVTLPRRCNAAILGILNINGNLIAYAACQARFILNSQTDWGHMDGKFDGGAFYDRITNYFKTGLEQGDEAVTALLSWYQTEVFENTGASTSDEPEDDSDDSDSEDEDAKIERQCQRRHTQRNTGNGATASDGDSRTRNNAGPTA